MMDFITKLDAKNLVIFGSFAIAGLLIALAAVAIVASRVQSVKIGKAEISGQTKKESEAKEDRKIFVEMMNFSWRLNQELADGEHFYKKQARREIKDHLYAYSVLIKSAYRKVLVDKNPDDYKLTYAAFVSTLDGQFYMRVMQVLMDCYEHNHITNVSELELRKKSDELYFQIVLIFQDFFMEPWLEEMCDYRDLQNACKSIEVKVKDMLFEAIKDIQTTLRQLYNMRTAIQNIKNCASAWIIENGLLPVQAEAMVDTFFEPVKGLNVDGVNEFLKLINL